MKYNTELIKIMGLFEQVTRVRLKDSFVDNNGLLTFVVDQAQLGKAVGKGAVNVKKLEKMLNRKIKIVEFSSDLLTFIKNLTYPLKLKDIEQDGDIVTIRGVDVKTNGLLIGRNASNLRNTESIVQKYFDIQEIKVQ